MAKNKRTDLDYLYGMSIYHEGKKALYSPFFSKKAYIINENNISHYTSYIQSYLIAMLVFLVSYILSKKLLLSIVLTILFLGVQIFLFYRNFIKKASFIDDFKKPHRESFIERQAANMDAKACWTVIICCPLLATFIMLNAYLNHYEGFNFILMVIIALIALAYGVLHLFVLRKIKERQ